MIPKSDSELRADLNSLDVEALRAQQLAHGRAKLSKEFRDYWAAQHALSRSITADPRHRRELRELAALLEVITSSISELAIDPVPTYYPYSDVCTIDWYLGDPHLSFQMSRVKAVTGIYYLLKDLADYEGGTLGGFHRDHRDNFEEREAVERLAMISHAEKICFNVGETLSGNWPPKYEIRRFTTLLDYLSEESRISTLVNFTSFPQTQFHDEVIFLRSIHISELSFFAIKNSIIEAINCLKHSAQSQASKALSQAANFAKLLQCAFKILRTMPPDRFRDFREATGKASAIQSRNYQLMEIYFRGPNKDEEHHFARIPHLKFLKNFEHPSFLHLGKALKLFSPSDEIMEKSKHLDSLLLAWRGVHLGFAKLYLRDLPSGTGDTEGAPYLQKILKSGLFEDTNLDFSAMEDMLPNIGQILQGVAVPVHRGIAPQHSDRNQ